MNKRLRSLAVATIAILLPFQAAAGESLRIGWGHLLPAEAAIPAQQKISAIPMPGDRDIALAENLEGKTIELSGYLLPADMEDGLVYAFMLVPRSGACAHMTQPPPSQVIRVVPEKPYRLSTNYEPVSVTGKLTLGLEKTQLFILDGVAVIESGYNIRMARVGPTDIPSGAGFDRTASPWRFLRHPPQ